MNDSTHINFEFTEFGRTVKLQKEFEDCVDMYEMMYFFAECISVAGFRMPNSMTVTQDGDTIEGQF